MAAASRACIPSSASGGAQCARTQSPTRHRIPEGGVRIESGGLVACLPPATPVGSTERARSPIAILLRGVTRPETKQKQGSGHRCLFCIHKGSVCAWSMPSARWGLFRTGPGITPCRDSESRVAPPPMRGLRRRRYGSVVLGLYRAAAAPTCLTIRSPHRQAAGGGCKATLTTSCGVRAASGERELG